MEDSPEPSPDREFPRVFGRYLLLRRLSRGGMGEVFMAKTGQVSGLEKICVVKKILPHLAEDQDFIRRFIDEAQVMVRLAHGNIAAMFEVGKAEGEYFLALEHVEGRDLRRLLARLYERRQRLPLGLALWIVREVLSGLAYAHRRTDADDRPLALVHCDVSPPNVMVSFEGEVKLIDFGIARSACRLSVTNPRFGFGKLGYMAPEQLIRGGVVDQRTDIYAAGVLLYELITGERLFHFPDGTDYQLIAREVAQGRHGLPSHCDPALGPLDALVERALATDPARRYQKAEELRDGLQQILARVDPTLTADRLGSHVRMLFADEIAEERTQRLQAEAVDLTPYAEELSSLRPHTVSFALVEPPALAEGDRTQRIEPRTRRRPWMVASVLGILLAVGLSAGVAALRDSERRGSRAISIQPPAPAPSAAGEPASVTAAVAAAAPAPGTPGRKAAPARPKLTDPAPAPPNEPAGPTIEAKYRAVKREYDAFKRRFGARLDGEWNDILALATFEKGEERVRKLDAALDRFRQRIRETEREMGGESSP